MTEEKKEQPTTPYYSHPRPELLPLIPTTANTILDIGCGAGELAKLIYQRQSTNITGIENNPTAAKAAKKIIYKLIEADAQTFDYAKIKPIPDAIILADILEHLPNPWQLLRNLTPIMKPTTKIIASIPLINHPSVIAELFRGLFRYTNAGLLDKTHLRFFTQTTIFHLFAQAGLKITYAAPHPSPENPVQLLLSAQTLSRQPKDPLLTIIIPTHNARPYTSQVLDSIAHTTDIPVKIIIVDNASTDDTIRFLRKQTNITHIENTHNLGFPTAVNIGLSLVRSPFFMIANNDLIFTQGAIKYMLELMLNHQQLGILGPVSNHVSGPQKHDIEPYTDEPTLQKNSLRFTNQHTNDLQPCPRIVFFCALLRSELLPQVGLLDEAFGLGNFEDDDYCLRTIKAGYQTAFTKSVYIHHYGETTFKENNIDYNQLMQRNLRIFIAKWGEDVLKNRNLIYETTKPTMA